MKFRRVTVICTDHTFTSDTSQANWRMLILFHIAVSKHICQPFEVRIFYQSIYILQSSATELFRWPLQRLWNTLPQNVTSTPSMSAFKKRLKTRHHFSHSFPESPSQWYCHFGHYYRYFYLLTYWHVCGRIAGANHAAVASSYGDDHQFSTRHQQRRSFRRFFALHEDPRSQRTRRLHLLHPQPFPARFQLTFNQLSLPSLRCR